MSAVLPPLATSSAVDAEVLAQVLEPYKPNCQYLRSAAYGVEAGKLATLSGELAIPESCYIASTGHFNAVEFNICYNQLAYCLIASCGHYRLLDAFVGWDLAEFKRRQLPDVLIVRFASEFRRPIDGSAFHGRIALLKVSMLKGALFLDTECAFSDAKGGRAAGKVRLAIVKGVSAR